jgi:hypothetical protein
MAKARADGKRQRINAYNVFILLFVGLGSLSYGYSAAVIGITLGIYSLQRSKHYFCWKCLIQIYRTAVFHQVL